MRLTNRHSVAWSYHPQHKWDYYFDQTPKEEIYTKCMEHLKFHYAENQFGISDKVTLKDALDRIQMKAGRRIYRNEESNNLVDLQTENRDWAKEDSINTYHLKSEWNDEDYLFETANYFIRLLQLFEEFFAFLLLLRRLVYILVWMVQKAEFSVGSADFLVRCILCDPKNSIRIERRCRSD